MELLRKDSIMGILQLIKKWWEEEKQRAADYSAAKEQPKNEVAPIATPKPTTKKRGRKKKGN